MEAIFTANGILAGIFLLVISFTGMISGFIRVLAFIVGIITTIHSSILLDRFLISNAEEFTVGRVYLGPRIPICKDPIRVEIRGTPETKVVYWPMGGDGIGGSNERLGLHGSSAHDIRTKALGAGVVVLDEQGRGIAMTERGCNEVLYKEIDGGAVKRARIS